jgi:hypothetical protein
MRIVQRHEWGARYPDGFRDAPLPAREVWLHHTAGAARNGADEIRAIEATGQNRFGGGISYTFLITVDGTPYEGHSVWRQGAHTGGRNDIARAICWVGNFEITDPPWAMVETTAALLRHGHAKGWWTRPHLTGGHRDLKATVCPGIRAYRLIGEINRFAAGSPAPPPEDELSWDTMLHDPYRNARGEPSADKKAGMLLAWAATHAAYAKEAAQRNERRLAGLQAAFDKLVDAHANQEGVDAEAIKAAVREAIEDSLVQVDVTVSDRTEGGAPLA